MRSRFRVELLSSFFHTKFLIASRSKEDGGLSRLCLGKHVKYSFPVVIYTYDNRYTFSEVSALKYIDRSMSDACRSVEILICLSCFLLTFSMNGIKYINHFIFRVKSAKVYVLCLIETMNRNQDC